MKTPEEIKKGLEYVSTTNVARKVALAKAGKMPYAYTEEVAADALAYIQQLEAKVLQWISVAERLPENEKTVLIATEWTFGDRYGREVAMAFRTNGKTFTGDSKYCWDVAYGDLDYDEENDEYIVPEGWWEAVRYSEEFKAIDDHVTHWMPLPELPKEEA